MFDVHLNTRVAGLRPSATVALNDLSNARLARGDTIFKLGLGQSPFPVPEPVVQCLQEHARQKDYLPVQGLHALREAVAAHHRRTFGIDCKPEDVLIGPGSKELMFLLQLAYDGDLVIPSPAWVSYAPQARILGRDIVNLPTTFENLWLVQPQQLETVCWQGEGCPRLLILNYPSNPTGQTYDGATLRELADVARRHRVILLSDEIYAKLHHRGEHESIVPLYPEGTIFSGGLSKWCGAGGWRLGVFVFPPTLRWLRDAMAAVGTETFTSTSAPIQFAAVRAFEGGDELDSYLRTSRRILAALGQHLAARLLEAGARVQFPAGGFYLFPDFGPLAESLHRRGIDSSAALCARLLEETGVAILPGSDFGRPAFELTARIAYVDFDGGAALAAAATRPADTPLDAAFLARYCGRVLEAVDRLCAWVTKP